MFLLLMVGVPTLTGGVSRLPRVPAADTITSHAAAWGDLPSEVSAELQGALTHKQREQLGWTPLHLAAISGSEDTVKMLLGAGAKVALTDCNGQTPLHAAASSGEDTICGLLVHAGAEVDALDCFGFTPLRWSVLNGHALAVHLFLEAGADSSTELEGMSPLELACAAGHLGVAATLIGAGAHRDRGCSFAIELATEMGHHEVAELVTAVAMNDGQILPSSSSPLSTDQPADPPTVRVVDAADLERDASLWRDAFASSTPLLVRGCGADWVEAIGREGTHGLRARWGAQKVTVAYSPDPFYHRPVRYVNGDDGAAMPAADDGGGGLGKGRPHYGQDTGASAAQLGHQYALCEMPLEQMRFDAFIDRLQVATDFLSVSQSAAASLDAFAGLEPADESASGLPPPLGRLVGSKCHRKNLWVCLPPKVSETHYDEDDSVLLQLSGTKRFTLVAPAPLHGLTAYPSLLPARRLTRRSEGVYEAETVSDVHDGSRRALKHFALLNASAPDLARFPLSRHARTVTIDVHEGCALLLPAYWYHRVESHSTEGQLNIAVNAWFDAEAGVGIPARLHRLLRERLHVDHTTERNKHEHHAHV